jgi:hypothetical protein
VILPVIEGETDMQDPKPTTERPSPATDPTNPYRQEATGNEVANENATERSQDEPGLTERDRDDRDPGKVDK